MKTTIILWGFILLLPVFVAIGHDFYANYMEDPRKQAKLEALDIDPAKFMISDLGYLFVTYAPDDYENTRRMMGEEQWNKTMEPVLGLYTVVAALIPFAFFCIWLILARIVGLPPFGGLRLKKTDHDMIVDRDKQQNFKYKRR